MNRKRRCCDLDGETEGENSQAERGEGLQFLGFVEIISHRLRILQGSAYLGGTLQPQVPHPLLASLATFLRIFTSKLIEILSGAKHLSMAPSSGTTKLLPFAKLTSFGPQRGGVDQLSDNIDPTFVSLSMIARCCKRYTLSALQFSLFVGTKGSSHREIHARDRILYSGAVPHF